MGYGFMHKMYPEVKALWVQALRSGEYEQGTKWLRQKRGGKNLFCCLGVLCNLHAQAHPEIAAVQKYKYEYMGAAQTLPDDVIEWAGLDSEDPSVSNGKFAVVNISYLNDIGHWSFEKLAKAIEEQF